MDYYKEDKELNKIKMMVMVFSTILYVSIALAIILTPFFVAFKSYGVLKVSWFWTLSPLYPVIIIWLLYFLVEGD